MTDKNLLLKEIVNKRQQSRWEGFRCLRDYHNGLYECNYVSPFTRSANNVNAKVMLVLQDWASDKYLRDCLPDPELIEMGHDPKLPTNKNLKPF
jgi:restriction system protein